MKKYSPFQQWLQKIQEGITPARLFVAVLLVVALLTGLVWVITRPKPDPLAQLTLDDIENRGALRVAVQEYVPLFSEEKTTDTGDAIRSGLEADVAHEISALIFDYPDSVDFTTTSFPLRNFMLAQDRVDCVIALSPQGYSDDFIYSNPYYTDAVAIVVLLDGATTIEQLYQSSSANVERTSRIGALTRQPESAGTVNPLVHQGALTVLESYNKDRNAGFSVEKYADAPGMFDDLRHGDLDAIAIEAALLPLYFRDDMRLLTNYIGTIPYSVAAMPNQQSLIDLTNIVIQNMKNQGTLAALLAKYNLKDYGS